MIRFIIVGFLINLNLGWAQNLVPNPSFEIYSTCPSNGDQISLAEPWTNVLAGIDYYHECGINGYSIPQSKYGGGYANFGEAYIGFGIWAIFPNINAREFVGVELIDSLIQGKRYNVEFYISMQDSVWYATKNMGAYFSVNQPPWSLSALLAMDPQIRYEGAEFLTEKDGWTKIEGSFIAQGGEKFITIGNFDTDAYTDTLFVSGGGELNPDFPNLWKVSGYFIDDVSVIVDTTTGIEDLDNEKDIRIYPNPTTGIFSVEVNFKEQEISYIELYTISGSKVYRNSLISGKTDLSINHLPAGIYFYSIFINDLKVQSGKQIIIK